MTEYTPIGCTDFDSADYLGAICSRTTSSYKKYHLFDKDTGLKASGKGFNTYEEAEKYLRGMGLLSAYIIKYSL